MRIKEHKDYGWKHFGIKGLGYTASKAVEVFALEPPTESKNKN